MPKGTKVYRCVQKLIKQGRDKATAIKICQESTGQSYKTGKSSQDSKSSKKLGSSPVGKNKMVSTIEGNR